MNRLRTFLVLAWVTAALVATDASAQTFDHLKCYKMTDELTFTSARADIAAVAAQFGLQNCEIRRRARQLCIPATKSVTMISGGQDSPFAAQNLAFEQTCYKIDCPDESIPDQQITDQFGTRMAHGFNAFMLCVPALLGPPQPPATTTTTTTTSTTTTTVATPTTTTTMPPPWSIGAGDGANQAAVGVAVDSAGNVVVIGRFQGSIDFGLGALTSAGGTDIFLVKFDPAGAPIWNERFGDASDQTPGGVAVDSVGRIVITGSFRGSVDFGGGALTSAGNDDFFVAKFEADGSPFWSQRYGGSADDDALAVAVNSQDQIVITGSYRSSSINFTSNSISLAGITDAFVAKFHPGGGAPEWAHGYGGSGAIVIGNAIATDSGDRIVIAGSLSGTANFSGSGGGGGGGGDLTAPGSGTDAVMWKLGNGGSRLWALNFGDQSDQTATGVACTPSEDILLTGTTAGTILFGGGPLTSAGGKDVFLARFDPSGAHQWSHLYGDASEQSSSGLAADASGNAHLVGSFFGSVDFGGGALTSAGASDAFVAEFTQLGAHTSSVAFAGAGEQHALDIAIGEAGQRYVVGEFEGTVDFGNGPVTSAGQTDAFIVRLSP